MLGSLRKRLSVSSDSELVEGVDDMTIETKGGGGSGSLKVTETGKQPRPEGIPAIVEWYAGKSKKGYAPYNPHKQNQDALSIEAHAPTGSMLVLCLDGHGEHGHTVAQYIKRRFGGLLFGNAHFAANLPLALTEAVAAVDQGLRKDSGIDSEFSGTTFVCMVLRGTKVTVANCGDSRASVARRAASGRLRGANISIDHKPDMPEEQARILKAGGRVFAVQYDDGVDGPARVWLKHTDIPGLAMSRSIGDGVAHSVGVSSIPEIFTEELDESAAMLIIASDGLWEFMTNQEVVDMIAAQRDRTKIVNDLIEESSKRWMKEEEVIDDTTVAVLFLKH